MASTKTETIRKRACKHQRWKAARALLIHIPGLCITALVLFYNLSERYWEPPGIQQQNVRLNALQFAAKILEMLIAASLSLIAANCMQYELLLGKGLPLGSVLVGFQITALGSAFSRNLWVNVFIKGLRTRRCLFILLLVVLAILCAIVGPSSDILMLPSTDWWPVDISSMRTMESEPPIFVNATESILWPTHITVENSIPTDCRAGNNTILEHCPAGGVFDIRDSIMRQQLSGKSNVLNTTLGVGPDYTRRIESLYQPFYLNDRNLAASVGTTTFISVESLLRQVDSRTGAKYYLEKNYRMELSLLGGRKMLVPHVSTFCTQEFEVLEKNPVVDSAFNSTLLSPNITPEERWIEDARTYKESLAKSQNSSVWITPRAVGRGSTIPLIAAIFFTTNEAHNSTGFLVACSVYAT